MGGIACLAVDIGMYWHLCQVQRMGARDTAPQSDLLRIHRAPAMTEEIYFLG